MHISQEELLAGIANIQKLSCQLETAGIRALNPAHEGLDAKLGQQAWGTTISIKDNHDTAMENSGNGFMQMAPDVL
jgi:hypothetical protein